MIGIATVTIETSISYRYRVACPWCGTTFAEFTCSVEVDSLTAEVRRCHGRRCDKPVTPRIRRVG